MDFTTIIKDFGKKLNLPDLAPENNVCRFQIDDMTIDIKLTGDEQHVLLFSRVCALPSVGLETLFRTLLKGNFLFEGTRAATLTIDSEAQDIYLQQLEAIDFLDGDRFYTLLEDFSNTVEQWRLLVEDYVRNYEEKDVDGRRENQTQLAEEKVEILTGADLLSRSFDMV